MSHIRYNDDPDEPDHRVHDWVKSLKEQQWTKNLSEQEILNQARIRVYYEVIPRPVKHNSQKEETLSSDSDNDDNEIIKLKIKLAKLELKLAKLKNKKVPKEQPLIQKQLIKTKPGNFFKKSPVPTKRIVFDIPEIEENNSSSVQTTETSEVEVYTDTSEDSSSNPVSSSSDSDTDQEQSNHVQEYVYEPAEQINGISSLRYVDIETYFPGFSINKIRCLSDSGCSLMLAHKDVFPSFVWQKQKYPKGIAFGNQQHTYLHFMAQSIKFKLGIRFYSFDFWQYDGMSYNIILGNPLWNLLQSQGFTHKDNIVKTSDNQFTMYEQNRNVVNEISSEFSHTERGGPITQNSEKLEVQNNIDWKTEIETILQDTFSDNPLALYSPDQPRCIIELLPEETLKAKRLNPPIRLKPITANPEDKEAFDSQIKELLDLKLIRESTSPWSFPAFMVRNHAEIKRGKPRMVINS